MASIIVAEGPREGDYYPLKEQTVVIGRDAKCPIQIVDPEISRVHLQVRFDRSDGSYHAKDLRSSNGVMVNGHRVAGEDEKKLSNGDLIDLGSATKLMYFHKDFPDRESAWEYYKLADERGKGTIIRGPSGRR